MGGDTQNGRFWIEDTVGERPVAGSVAAWTVLLATLAIVMAAAAASAGHEHAERAAPRSTAPLAAPLVSPVTTTTVLPADACRVTIRGASVALHDRPSRGSRALLEVPRGDYVVAASRSLTAGTEQHWLLIDVGGISGWVRNVADHLEVDVPACA